MGERGAVTEALADLAGEELDDQSVGERLCQACVEGLDVDGAALSLLTAMAARETLWATDSVAQRLEDLQFSLNEGACIEAATTGAPVLVPDLFHTTETARWPVFAAAVAEQTPVAALFALPLQWGAATIGVLDLYRCTPGELSRAGWRDALAAADTAALLLLGRRTRPPPAPDGPPSSSPDGGRDGDGWGPGVFSRPEVHQATGMVMAQLGISSEEALARLRAHAFAEQRLLVDVAGDVVARRFRFTEEMR
ncbi:ANTAR domain-containing protein [Pseudonocardia pini]|uniref:ANTAR domain-containing protein n=1 Tax=Pseudonocardia pini TaxID=2758030 RepID=UPI0015F08C9E|nr:ANTAR domain-containing protein [Pseudonocardia pini]